MGQPKPREAMTWELALAIRFRCPVATSLVVATLALGSFVAVRWLMGAPLLTNAPDAITPFERLAIVGITTSLLIGYAIFGNGFLYLGRHKELARIGIVDPPTTAADFRALRRSRVFGALGALLGFVLVASSPGGYGLRLDLADADYFWFLAAAPTLLWLVARAFYFTLRPDRTLQRVRARDIDLLRLEPVLMFGRLGVQSALVWVVGTSIAVPLALGLSIALLPFMGVTLSVAVAVLVLSVRGLTDRIREAKRVELAKIATRLEQARDAALAGDPERRGQLSDLLAYRSYIESIRESPIDSPTLVRFAVYLLIPLGSWSASAIVERIVDTMLD
jgi:hypothetical protein